MSVAHVRILLALLFEALLTARNWARKWLLARVNSNVVIQSWSWLTTAVAMRTLKCILAHITNRIHSIEFLNASASIHMTALASPLRCLSQSSLAFEEIDKTEATTFSSTMTSSKSTCLRSCASTLIIFFPVVSILNNLFASRPVWDVAH